MNEELNWKPETETLFGKLIKICPNKLRVNGHMIAHVTDAKIPLKQTKNRTTVIAY